MLIHQPGRKRGRREAAGGAGRSFPAARSRGGAGGGGGGGAPFPPRADCCGVLPAPARACGAGERAGRPDGGNRGFRGRRAALSSSEGVREGGRWLSRAAASPAWSPELRAGGQSPGGSGWRSSAAAAAAAGARRRRRALGGGTFLRLAAGGSPLDTHRLRGTCRPRGPAGKPTPGPPGHAASPAAPPRPRALQAARCALAPLRAPRLLHGRRRSGRPDPRAWQGGWPWWGAEEPGPAAGGAWGAGRARVGRARALRGAGQTSPPRPPSSRCPAAS